MSRPLHQGMGGGPVAWLGFQLLEPNAVLLDLKGMVPRELGALRL